MVYITGDKHADFSGVFDFCYDKKTSLDDVLIILGDAGINYYANYKVQMCDTTEKIETFMEMFKGISIVEVARTGTLALQKCKETD